MCQANHEKQRTANDGRNRTTKSGKIRTFWEKEIYKYSGIVEADTFNQVEILKK